MKSSTIICLCVLMLSSVIQALGQKKDTVSVYFDHNVYQTFDAEAIDSLVKALKYQERVRVVGYTDYLGTVSYNIDLSKKRAKAVMSYIIENGRGKLKISSMEGKGELKTDIENGEGVPHDRRVDIIVHYDNTLQDEIVVRKAEIINMDTSKGSSLVLEGLSFIPGRHYPLPESGPILESLLITLKEYKDIKAEIQGFICCEYQNFDGIDMDTKEPRLSENRAKFVYEYLIENGIDEDRLSYKGLGGSLPKVFPEVTEADRQANRRVEIMVVH